MKMSRTIVALAAAAALVAGCGEGTDAETAEAPAGPPLELEVSVDGYPGPENAGIMLAEAHGHFGDAGLEAFMHYPVTPARPVQYVLNGSIHFALSYMPEIVLAQERGAPVVAVAGVLPEPTAAMVWLEKSGIDEIADLEGKTIAFPGLQFERRLLESILARAGLTLADVKVKILFYNVMPALADGNADAIFGPSWAVKTDRLEARGLEPVITPVQDLGVPSYEEVVLMVHRDRLSEDPESIRDFISAMDRGTAEALEDPEAAGELITNRNGSYSRNSPAEFEATVPLLSESGEMSEEQAGELVDWMYEEGLIERKPPVSALLTNEYLP